MEQDYLIDYHIVKDTWRPVLDREFDHRMVLFVHDPLLEGAGQAYMDRVYPGLKVVQFVPTVENLAFEMVAMARAAFGDKYKYAIELWEGENNCGVAS